MRLFTFGCSFTQFLWPTWADLIAYDLDCEFENWGRSGAGNEYIFSSIIKCDNINKINKNDLVIVNWTCWAREDRVKADGKWKCGGNIFHNGEYDTRFLKKYHNYYNDAIKNSNYIMAVNKMYDISFQSHMMDYSKNVEINSSLGYDDILKENTHIILPKKIIFDLDSNSKFGGECYDHHPDILCHLNHVKTIYKNIGYTLSQKTIDYAHTIQEKIQSKIAPARNWNDLLRIMEGLIPDWHETLHHKR